MARDAIFVEQFRLGGDGPTVAVKDCIDIAGWPTRAGSEALTDVSPAGRHADVVEAILAAGGCIVGKTNMHELAYGVTGVNRWLGTPLNTRYPDLIPGGSSSGSAAAIAAGLADVAIGTDTGGSIRVPAAYQGLWGIRTTHGVVPTNGLLPLARSFDTVGWLTRTPELLAAVAGVLLPSDTATLGQVVTCEALTALADPEVATAVSGFDAAPIDWPVIPGWLVAFQTLQAWEAWQVHGEWLTGRLDTLGSDVRSRFQRASSITPDEAAQAAGDVARIRLEIRELLGHRVLLLPSASSVAPPVNDASALDAVRQATMQLTCVAGIAGLPTVSIPVTTADGLPAGAALVGPAGSDRALIALAAEMRDA